MRPRSLIAFLACISVLSVVLPAGAAEIETRFATVVYERDDLLRRFNEEVSLRSLSYLLRNRGSLTMADEVRNKIDVIVERVETILEMFPKTLKFTVVLVASDQEVRKVYKNRYGRHADFIAFYSPREKTVYVSVRDANLHVFAHEIAHVVIDQYFGVSPSVKIHEVLAQFVESHIED